MYGKRITDILRRMGMKKIAWSLLAASAMVWAACAAWGRSTVDYNEVTAESLVTSPQASWARAILFTDELVELPAAKWKRLERKNYAEMRLRTVGTVWIPEGKLQAFEGLQPGRLYSFGGTVDQFSRRYYVIVDAVFELQTGDDLSAHWTGMLDGGAGEDDPALQGVLLQVQNRLIQMAKEQGVTVAQLVEAQTDGGQRLAQVVAAEAMQSEFKAKNTTAEEVLIDSVLALLQKQVVMEGADAGAGAAPEVAAADAPAAGLSMDGWDGEVQAAAEPEEIPVAEESAPDAEALADVPEMPEMAVPEGIEMAAAPGEAADALEGASDGDWWEGLEETTPEADGEEIESMGDVLAGVESMDEFGEAAPTEDATLEAALDDLGDTVPGLSDEIPFEEEVAPEADVSETDDFPAVPEADDGAWAEQDGIPVEEETVPEAEIPEMPEMDDFENVPVLDEVTEEVAEGGDAGLDVPPMTEEIAEEPIAEFPEQAVVEPISDLVPMVGLPVAEPVVEPVAEPIAEPVVAGDLADGRIMPLGGGALTPRVSLEPTREELEAAAREAEEQARMAEEEARRAEKEAREEAKRQEKERKEAEAEARRLEKEAARAAEAREREEEEARRAAEKALAKRLKEEAKAAARDQNARQEALEAQRAAAVEAARAAERMKNAEAAALAEREAHAAQIKEAEARRAAAAAALEAAERDKAAALAKIEADMEAAYAAEAASRAAERAKEEAQYAAELEQARQIEAEERAKAEEAERRIAEAKAEAEKDRERMKAAEAEAKEAERAAARAQKERDRMEAEARKAEKNRRDGDNRDAAALSRAEEKARQAEARRREREEREAAERKAKEERRAAEEAKRAAEEAKRQVEAQKKASSKPTAADLDFWSRPVKW